MDTEFEKALLKNDMGPIKPSYLNQYNVHPPTTTLLNVSNLFKLAKGTFLDNVPNDIIKEIQSFLPVPFALEITEERVDLMAGAPVRMVAMMNAKVIQSRLYKGNDILVRGEAHNILVTKDKWGSSVFLSDYKVTPRATHIIFGENVKGVSFAGALQLNVFLDEGQLAHNINITKKSDWDFQAKENGQVYAVFPHVMNIGASRDGSRVQNVALSVEIASLLYGFMELFGGAINHHASSFLVELTSDNNWDFHKGSQAMNASNEKVSWCPLTTSNGNGVDVNQFHYMIKKSSIIANFHISQSRAELDVVSRQVRNIGNFRNEMWRRDKERTIAPKCEAEQSCRARHLSAMKLCTSPKKPMIEILYLFEQLAENGLINKSFVLNHEILKEVEDYLVNWNESTNVNTRFYLENICELFGINDEIPSIKQQMQSSQLVTNISDTGDYTFDPPKPTIDVLNENLAFPAHCNGKLHVIKARDYILTKSTAPQAVSGKLYVSKHHHQPRSNMDSTNVTMEVDETSNPQQDEDYEMKEQQKASTLDQLCEMDYNMMMI